MKTGVKIVIALGAFAIIMVIVCLSYLSLSEDYYKLGTSAKSEIAGTESLIESDGNITPNIIAYDKMNNDINYSYVVDKNTGCVYIVCRNYSDSRSAVFGITPAINPDGTAVTAEQLGLSY